MIDASELSVVISGPILGSKQDRKEYTRKTCESVRKFFPGAEIVLSTWENEEVSGLDYDELVLSLDPGSSTGNVNRQICSRTAGIKKASREYVLAIRSESKIVRTDFMEDIDKYESHLGRYRFLKHRIVIPATYPACRGELFHIGDWYFLGHKEDLLKFWDVPYMDDSLYNNSEDDLLYNPHRYLITSFVKKYYPLEFLKKSDINDKNKEIYEAVIAENFVVTGFYEYGIESLKYPLSHTLFNKLFHREVGYTFCEWEELYNKYSGGNLKVKKTLSEKFLINICVPIKRSKVGRLFFKVRKKLFKLDYWE